MQYPSGSDLSIQCALCDKAGDAEPVSVDSKGAKVLQQGTCVVEQRVQLDGRDCILRCVTLSTLGIAGI